MSRTRGKPGASGGGATGAGRIADKEETKRRMRLLEVVMAEFLVAGVPAQTSYAAVGEVLAGVEVLAGILSMNSEVSNDRVSGNGMSTALVMRSFVYSQNPQGHDLIAGDWTRDTPSG